MIANAKNQKVVSIGGKAGKRIERAAKAVNRDAKEVERLPFDLSALEEEGVFVNVDASGFGMLNRRLDWQALGIRLPEDTDIAFHPPRCGVLPNRYRRPLLTPAAQAHQALHKYSYHFRLTETLFETPAYRWLTWRAFSEFEAAFAAAGNDLRIALVMNRTGRTRAESEAALAAERGVVQQAIEQLLESREHLS